MLDRLNSADGACKPDWDAIRRDFEAGELSIREIARREGISDTAIRKRAKADGWKSGLQLGSHIVAEHGLQVDANQSVETVQTTPLTELQTDRPGPNPHSDDNEEDDKWEWKPENPDVVTPTQHAIAVYFNRWHQIVIRQATREFADEDTYIVLSRHDVAALIKRLDTLSRE
jgi:hypothetical protein